MKQLPHVPKKLLGVGCLLGVVVVLVGMLWPSGAPAPTHEFGVVSDPWAVQKWSDAIGITPTMPMEFEAWARGRTLDSHFAQAKRSGFKSYMVTWEPWQTVDPSAGQAAQGAAQPEYANASIAAGKHDAYIRAFARSVAHSGLQNVYIRYAHEMNGDWYPWSHDSANYIVAWRHIVDIFRTEGAHNARFVYSTNPSLYQTDAQWAAGFWKYWPGAGYVDYVGSTMINFGSATCTAIPCAGGHRGYPVRLFAQRLAMDHTLSHKQVMVTEFNTAQAGSVAWLDTMAAWLQQNTAWIKGVTISQAPSRGAAHMSTGNLSWNVIDYPDTHAAVRRMVITLTTAP